MSEERITVHESELVNPRQFGRFIRAVCHIHGGKDRNLSINTTNGYGECFTCHAKVRVPEFAPEGVSGPPQKKRPASANDLLRPRRRVAPGVPEPEEWHRDEVAKLTSWYPTMRERLEDERPRDYLAARGIPFDVARDTGVGHVPTDARLSGYMAKWRDRLIFPLSSPAGPGFYGRSLHDWAPGRDVNEHAAWLKRKDRSAGDVKAWGHCHEKTYPSGMFGFGTLATAESVVLVEGTIDALALIAAGLDPADVVALIGTAARVEWFAVERCQRLRGVVLALDYDKPEARQAAQELEQKLWHNGIRVQRCEPPQDGNGKDWSERWSRMQYSGVWNVFDALDALTAPAPATVVASPAAAPVVESTVPAPIADVDSAEPWQSDAVIRHLIEHGFTLTNGHLIHRQAELFATV